MIDSGHPRPFCTGIETSGSAGWADDQRLACGILLRSADLVRAAPWPQTVNIVRRIKTTSAFGAVA